MAIAKSIPVHTVRHMWSAYVTKTLLENPHYMGVCTDVMGSQSKDTIYDKRYVGTPRIVRVTYKGKTNRSWNRKIYGTKGMVINYTEFKKIIVTWFRLAKKKLLDAQAVHIRNIGKLCMVRVERDFRKVNHKAIDWAKTMREPKIWDEEQEKMVASKVHYFTDDDWCRAGWFKQRIKNVVFYEFSPAESQSGTTNGFKQQISTALFANPLLKFRFLYNPVKSIEYVYEDELQTETT